MLEALVDKTNLEIIVVKKKPATWSNFEKSLFTIVDLDDSTLEAKVNEISVYPYRQFFEDGTITKKAISANAINNAVITPNDLVDI